MVTKILTIVRETTFVPTFAGSQMLKTFKMLKQVKHKLTKFKCFDLYKCTQEPWFGSSAHRVTPSARSVLATFVAKACILITITSYRVLVFRFLHEPRTVVISIVL